MPAEISYLPLRLAILVLTFCLSGFFSGSETALFSFQPHELKRMAGLHGADGVIYRLRERPKRLLTTILFGNMVVNVVFYSVSFLLIVDLKPAVGRTGGVALGLASLMTVILGGEVMPKNLAVMVYHTWGRLAAYPLWVLEHALLVIVVPLEAAADLVVSLFERGHRPEMETEELQQLVGLAAREGTLDFGAGRMIAEVIELSDLGVAEVMVPRVEMTTFDVDDDPQGLLKLFRTAKLTMIPLYEGETDNMVGVVHVKDVLYRRDDAPLKQLARPIPFLPETATVEEALARCRTVHSKTAFVVDEYGAVVGLVTVEDLLEEIVGEIADEYDKAERPGPMEFLSDGTVRLQGRLSLRTWQQMFPAPAPPTKVNTVGGLVMSLLGKVPEAGDSVEWQQMEFTVESVYGRRVGSVLMRTLPGRNVQSGGGNPA